MLYYHHINIADIRTIIAFFILGDAVTRGSALNKSMTYYKFGELMPKHLTSVLRNLPPNYFLSDSANFKLLALDTKKLVAIQIVQKFGMWTLLILLCMYV